MVVLLVAAHENGLDAVAAACCKALVEGSKAPTPFSTSSHGTVRPTTPR